MKIARTRRLLWPALALGLTLWGCSVFSRLPRSLPFRGNIPTSVLPSDYHDYTGVIHIHTRYSDGAGTYEDIIRVANAQRLDYLVVTDHNTLQPLRDGRQGWHGGTLVLVGDEISTRGGHYVTMNITQEINHHALTTQEIIDEVNRQGGLGFIAHPYFKKRRWTDWSVKGFVGIEGYNIAHDALDENKLRLALWTLTVPVEPFYLSILDRPYDPLSMWDELIKRHGRVTGIGSADAHEVRVLGVTFAPYEIMFRLIRTHVLIPSDTLTPDGLYDALRRGHAYFSMELLAEARGFEFQAESQHRLVGIMGDEIPWTSDLHVVSALPAPAQLTLFQDGQATATTTAQMWDVPITEPGVYRLEATRHDKPWIFSNPLYIRPAAPPPRPSPSAPAPVQTILPAQTPPGQTPTVAPPTEAHPTSTPSSSPARAPEPVPSTTSDAQ